MIQYTMNAVAPPLGYAIFQVADLSLTPEYCHIPAIHNPGLRFYAGTPLISSQGIRVGTLCVLDERPRPLLDEFEQHFLGSMASAVMRHLELERERQLHSRYTKMSRGLADLVTRETAHLGRYSVDEESEDEDHHHTPSRAPENEGSDGSEVSRPVSNGSSASSSTHDLGNTGSQTYRKIFTTAADILRQALDGDLSILAENFDDLKQWSFSEESRLGISYSAGKKPFMEAILAHEHPDNIVDILCERWPLGKIWVRDDMNNFVGVEDDRFRPHNRDQRRSSTRSFDSQPDNEECEWLGNWLPKARQVMFVPLWDPTTTDSPSACFVMTQKNHPAFTAEVEVPFIRAFLNSLSVVCGHLTMRLADQQKDQLLSSMSHELRSPLHGIIASNEMLSSTNLDQKQLDLCESIDVCSQTLLDTMSLVMDHAMVNSFVEGRSKNPFKSNAGPSVHAGSSLHLESTCNVAALCEEGIDITRTAFVNLAKVNGALPTAPTEEPPIEIDFRASRADWTFLCSPGIIRRLVMNLVSNSMKYTASGLIEVTLSMAEQHNGDDDAGITKSVILTVSDTGKGMSRAFLKNGLFLPFSQESSDAPGLGLGLSIVRASVASLGGTIDVDSGQDKGTLVTVKFPAKRPPKCEGVPNDTNTNTRHSGLELQPLKTPPGKTYRKFGPTLNSTLRHRETLGVYLKDWWLFERVDDESVKVDWTFLYESDVDLPLPPSHSYIVLTTALSSGSVRRSAESPFVYLKVPFGPKVLSKALQLGTRSRQSSATDLSSLGPNYDIAHRPRLHQRISSRQLSVTSPLTSPKQPLEFEGAVPLPPRRLSAAANIGIPSPSSPLAQSIKRPNDYFGVHHANSDTAVQTLKPIPPAKSVLCVDDNPINLRLLATYCAKLGFTRVVTAENGLKAVEAVKEASPAGGAPGVNQPFDVVFMDLTMPVCDGFEATRRIREFEREAQELSLDDNIQAKVGDDHSSISNDVDSVDRDRGSESSTSHTPPPRAHIPRTTVIAITALASESDQKKAFSAGIDHFVTKPLRFKDLRLLLVDLGVL
jgi:signal transduction histidine kinase/CheY-like chemotaxis protein